MATKLVSPILRQVRDSLRDVPVRAFSERSFAALAQLHPEWDLKPRRLLGELVGAELLRELKLRSEYGYAPKVRYATPEATPFEVALSLQKGAYLCHASAAFLHGLTDEMPQTFYVNVEQTAKPAPEGDLRQDAIDRAFRNAQRASRFVFLSDPHRFVQLSGKNSKRHGVVDVPLEPQRSARVVACTNLERTLIDLVVRPNYGGGVHRVVAAFALGKDRTSVSKLLACLRALDYRYPYHQALGFYLERAGFPSEHLNRLRELPRPVKFYLTYGMRDPEFNASWSIYHPKAL